MAFSILYKKLFEVWILHPFYLDHANKKKFYEFDEEARAKAIKTYDISGDFGIVPTGECQRLLANQKMRMLPTPFGFIVAVKVNEATHNGHKVYTPVISLEAGQKFRFRIRIKRQAFYNYTNTQLHSNLRAQYFLSNLANSESMVYPSLSRKAPKYLKGKQYEMGELVTRGNNLYQAVVRTTALPRASAGGKGPWVKTADHRYLNERDRLISHYVIQYSFAVGAAISRATFTLKNGDGEVVAEKEIQPASPATSYQWDLSDYFEPDPFDPDKDLLKEGPYILEVRGNDNYIDSKHILIDNHLSGGKASPALARQARETFMVIEVGHRAGLGRFRLLEPAGHLRMEMEDGQLRLSPPIFEVRLQNRHTYWNYVWHPHQIIKPEAPYVDVETDPDDDTRLITSSPQPLTQLPSSISLKGAVKLPNPESAMLNTKPDGKICSEVFLAKIAT